MKDFTTKSGAQTADEIILVQVEDKITGTAKWLQIDPEDQELIFGPMRLKYPPSTIEEVFPRFKDSVERKARQNGQPIQIEAADIDFSRLADYIGFLRKHWEDPQDAKVSFKNTEMDGVFLTLPQDPGSVRLNYVVQRFIHNRSQKGAPLTEISADLVAMHTKASLPHTALLPNSVLRLRCLICEKLQKHPDDEGIHWNNVRQRYGMNEDIYSLKTHYILQGQPNRPAMSVESAPEQGGGQGGSLSAPAAPSPSSSSQESKSPMSDLMMTSGLKPRKS